MIAASSRRGLLMAVFLLFCGSLWAQEFRGTITGRVADPQGAVIPGAKVTAIQLATGAKSESTASSEGQYTIPFLAPGQYKVEAQAAGFKQYVREGLQVSAGERVGLDISLEVGALTEVISVTAEAPLLETTSATAGQVINSAQVENMPMNGRTPLVLAQLAFGVVPNSDPKFNRPFDNQGPSQFSMGGAPAQNNELLIDGSPDTTGNLRVAYNPPVDAVQEVRVHAFEADAAYGHTGGGTANVIMRGGTNELHGSAYEFNQTSALAATPFFTNKAGQEKPVTRYNQWGFSAGAPIWIPKVFNGKNKVFWFYGMEFINDSFPEPTVNTVPTAAERTGDLSALLKLGSNYQIYDPYSGVKQGSRIARTPIPNNVIPTNYLSPVAKNVLQFYPLPNIPGNPDGQSNYLTNAVRKDTYNSEIGRLDFNLGSRDKMFWNFRHNDRIEDRYNFWNNVAHGQYLGRINWGTMLDNVYTVNNSTVADVRLNWTRFRESNATPGDGFDGTKLGFPAGIAAVSPRLQLPHFTFDHFTEIVNNNDSNTPYDIFQIFADVVKIAGAHSLKAGVDARELRESSAGYGYSEGQYSFNSNWTKGPLDNSTSAPMGQDWASFMMGLPTGGGLDMNAFRTNQAKYMALFIQDDWRVKSNLTINLGLRFEHDFPTVERFNRSLNGFDPTTPNPISAAAIAAFNTNPVAPIAAGQFKVNGGPLFASSSNPNVYSPQSKMFSPRFGFAWTPGGSDHKTVIRGGGGVFMFPIGTTGINQPGFSQTTSIVPSLDSYLTPYSTLGNPYPAGFQYPTGSSLGLATYLGKSLTFYNPVPTNPYSVRWEMSVQRELPGNSVLELAYIGNHAVHMSLNRQLDTLPAQYLSTSPVRDQPTIDDLSSLVANPFQNLIPGTSMNGSTISRSQLLYPFPQFTGATDSNTNAASSYFHSLDVRVEKRYSHGLMLLANFTYSKLIARDNYKNDTDLAPEKRIAADDRPLRFVASASYNLPMGTGKKLDFHSGILNRIVGGWTLNTIYTNQIGAPLTFGNNLIFYGGDLHSVAHPENVDVPMFDVTRFNRISTQQLSSNIHTFGTRYGNLRQDGANNVDLSILKDTQITERVKFQLRGEAFNAFNRPEFDYPKSTIDNPTSSTFGIITNQPNLARSIQLGARLVW
jgi:hypothetical protein